MIGIFNICVHIACKTVLECKGEKAGINIPHTNRYHVFDGHNGRERLIIAGRVAHDET